MLSSLLKNELFRRNLSRDEAAGEIGVSPEALRFALEGKPVGIGSLGKICDWLGVSTYDVVKELADPELSFSYHLLRSLPRLAILHSQAEQAHEAGAMQQKEYKLITDYVLYTGYLLSQRM